jgi:hypothetical protein
MANTINIVIRATDQASAQFTAISTRARTMGEQTSAAFRAAQGPLIVLGGLIGGSVLQFGRLGDQVQKMALRTGFSTEALSELRFALGQSGSSIEGFEAGVRRMASFIDDATAGLSTQTRALEALGLSLADLQGLSAEDTFFRLATAMAQVEDEVTKAALAQDVFGRSGTQLLPLLNAGADGMAALRQEARDLGLVMDQEAADKAAAMQDAIDSARQSLNGLAIEIGGTVAPAVTAIARGFSELPSVLQTVAVTAAAAFAAIRIGLLTVRSALITTGLGAALVGIGLALDFIAARAGNSATAVDAAARIQARAMAMTRVELDATITELERQNQHYADYIRVLSNLTPEQARFTEGLAEFRGEVLPIPEAIDRMTTAIADNGFELGVYRLRLQEAGGAIVETGTSLEMLRQQSQEYAAALSTMNSRMLATKLITELLNSGLDVMSAEFDQVLGDIGRQVRALQALEFQIESLLGDVLLVPPPIREIATEGAAAFRRLGAEADEAAPKVKRVAAATDAVTESLARLQRQQRQTQLRTAQGLLGGIDELIASGPIGGAAGVFGKGLFAGDQATLAGQISNTLAFASSGLGAVDFTGSGSTLGPAIQATAAAQQYLIDAGLLTPGGNGPGHLVAAQGVTQQDMLDALSHISITLEINGEQFGNVVAQTNADLAEQGR